MGFRLNIQSGIPSKLYVSLPENSYVSSTVNVSEVFFESWDIKCFENILDPKAENCIALLDINFARSQKGREITTFQNTEVIDTHHEPTTIQVDQIFHNLKANFD